MICPQCGRETSGKFCPFCGAKLNTEAAAPQAANPVNQQNREYASNQPYNPGFAYNQNQNPGYAPNQGYMPNRPATSYQGAPAGALGQSPAIQALRKVATSPAFLLALLLYTVGFLFSTYINIKNLGIYFDYLDYYKRSSLQGQIIGNIVGTFLSILLSVATVTALWSIFASAANKTKERIGTGGLTYFKVIYIIGLVFACIALLAFVVLLVVVATKDSNSFLRILYKEIDSALGNAGYDLPTYGNLRTFLCILVGIALLIMVFTVIYFVKIIKSINTAKRVIQTGVPDDRVSVFVGVITIIIAVFGVINGIRVFAELRETMALMNMNKTLAIFYGIITIVSAVSTLCFAITLFQFRSAMRRLGVRKGVMQYNPN